MRIAIFSDTFVPEVNGVANVVYQSALGLAELGHNVCVFTVTQPQQKNYETITQGKFSIVSLPSVRIPIYLAVRGALPFGLAVRQAKKFRPEVIHTHTPFLVGLEALWAAKRLKVPLVGTHHTFYDYYLKYIKLDYNWAKKPSWKVINAYYNRCSLILTPTQSLANTLKLHHLKKPLALMHNPVDTQTFQPVGSPEKKQELKIKLGAGNNKLLIYMGRVSYEKSLDQALQAFSLVLKKIPGCKFLIVGDGPEKNNLKKLAADLGIARDVIFTGFIFGQALTEAMQAGDLFITASVSENMPVSILQAMASGLPVVATDTLGIPEIVKQGENGYLSAAGQAEELAKNAVELLQNPKTREQFSHNSRALSLNYSRQNISRLLEQTYRQLTAKIHQAA